MSWGRRLSLCAYYVNTILKTEAALFAKCALELLQCNTYMYAENQRQETHTCVGVSSHKRYLLMEKH